MMQAIRLGFGVQERAGNGKLRGQPAIERLAGRLMLLHGWRRTLAAIGAGAFAVLALPPFDFFAAMFVSMPVLVWLLDGASGDPDRGPLGRSLPAFVTGWAFGFGYFVAGLWWLGGALLVEAGAFAWAIPLAVLGLPTFLALFFGLGTALARMLWSDGFGRITALAAGLTFSEWLRGFVLTGFPWNTLGHAAMPLPLAMQSVTVLGLLGVTALSIVVFAAPALIATRRDARIGLAVALVLTAGHLGYGFHVLSRHPLGPAGEDALGVRLVQPSIPQAAKWSEAERESILRTYLDLTTADSGGPAPELIVWPETAIPYLVTESPDVLAEIAEALEPGQRLAMGGIRIDDSGGPGSLRYYNAIMVIGSDGEILDAADKVHLVPFGEYLPFGDWLAQTGLTAIAEIPVGFTAAAKRRPLDLGHGISALPLICYEAIFPLRPDALPERPDAIVNVTNDAWFGATPGPYQHFRQAQLRAVESRLPMLRAGNNGISAVTDAHGRIVEGLKLNAVGFVDATLPPPGVSEWDSSDRRRNLWFISGILLLVSIGGRASFRKQ